MGPRIKRGVNLDAKLLDMSPTLLKILRVESTNDFDGQVLDGVIAS